MFCIKHHRGKLESPLFVPYHQASQLPCLLPAAPFGTHTFLISESCAPDRGSFRLHLAPGRYYPSSAMIPALKRTTPPHPCPIPQR